MLRRSAHHFLVLCLTGLPTLAQQVTTVRVKTAKGPYLRFDQFTVNDDNFKQAPNKTLQLHDSRGYLWFVSESNGAHRLMRYDGTYAKSFDGVKGPLLGSYGHSLVLDDKLVREDEDHQIWIATSTGLNLFDPVTETFRPFRNPFLSKQGIGDWVMGKAGKNWVTTHEMPDKRPIRPFFEFNSRTRRFRKISPAMLINGYTQQPEATRPVSFEPKSVDKQGRVWGNVRTTTNTPGHYDPATNWLVWYPIRRFLTQKSVKADEQLETITDIIPDGRYVWISSFSRIGLLRLEPQTGRWKQFHFSSISYNRILQIVPRNNHQFWLQTDKNPVLFDKTTETLYVYPYEPGNAFGAGRDVRPYVMSRQQSLWLGQYLATNNATLSVLHEPKQFFTFRGDSADNFAMLHKNGHLLYFSSHLATKRQLVFTEYNELTRTQTVLYALSLGTFLEQTLHTALRDSLNRTMWLIGNTSAGSICRFDEKSRMVSPVRATIQGLPPGENQLSDYDEIRAVAQDTSGNIWFPTYGDRHGGNLLKFDTRTQQFVGFRAGTHGLPVGQIRSIMADWQGKLWLGYRTGGPVYRFDPATNLATALLKTTGRDGTDATKIIDDPARQKVWIARSEDGIWQYDRRTKTSRRVSHDEIYGSNFHLTKRGIFWYKTATGLVRFDPETGQKIRLGVEYDLHDFIWPRLSKTADDEFFFEKFRFYDHAIKRDTAKPAVVFSFLKVFDQELRLPQSLNHTNVLDLNYDQNFFTIGFSALSYFQSERNQYMYRLVGFNKDWVRCDNKPLAVFSNVPPGTYPLQIKGSNNDGIWSDVKTLTIHIIPPFWQTGWFRLLAVSLLAAAVVMLYRFQLERRTLQSRLEAEAAKRLQGEAEMKEQEAAYKLKLSATEMAALRSQMNPHFIFNCLNSIQYFTAQNDAERASDYLTKFSRLIRLVLENSKSERVTLQNELETLRLYIEMETMRFGQKVGYQMQVSEGIDTDTLEIPPLLLQPFVENAIWHGLMHKEEGGTVSVSVQQPKPDRLHIEITDNGVGRAKAAEYKSKSATKQKSFGMKMTADRIELINQLYHTHTLVKIDDLVDERGQPAGTRVIVEIPV